MLPAGALPAGRTRTVPPERAWSSAAAIWLRPALCTHTKRTSVILDGAAFFGVRVCVGTAGHIPIVARFCVFKNRIHFPASAVRIRRPHLCLLGIAACLFALYVNRQTGRSQTRDRRVDGLSRIDDDAEMFCPAGVRLRRAIERKFQSRIVGDKERVVIKRFCRLRIEQRTVKGNALCEIASSEIQM